MARTTISPDNTVRARTPRRILSVTLFLALVAGLLVAVPTAAHAACSGNAIACENQLPGTPESEWDIDGVGDDQHPRFRHPDQCQRRFHGQLQD